MRKILLTVIAIALSVSAYAAENQAKPVRCPVIKDTTVYAYARGNVTERDCNAGARPIIRIKGWNDVGLLNFNFVDVVGKEVVSAKLYVRIATQEQMEELKWKGVHAGEYKDNKIIALAYSTVPMKWVEGKAGKDNDYVVEKGSVCFLSPSLGNSNWTVEGSTIFDCIFGSASSIKGFSRPEVLKDGWLAFDISPEVISTLALNKHDGLAIKETKMQLMTNNAIYSRESGIENAPYIVAQVREAKDAEKLSTPELKADVIPTYSGEAVVTWQGVKGALGYDVTLDGKSVEQWRVPTQPLITGPAANLPWTRKGDVPAVGVVACRLDFLPAGKKVVAVNAYDALGNVSETASLTIEVPKLKVVADLAKAKKLKATAKGEAKGLSVWAVTDTEKVNPLNGTRLGQGTTGEGEDDFKKTNSVWNATSASVSLIAAKSEIVAFQLVIDAPNGLSDVSVKLAAKDGAKVFANENVDFFRTWYVPDANEKWQPDACVPLTESFNIPWVENKVPSQKNQTVWVDVKVPTDAKEGIEEGYITVEAGGKTATIGITLEVLPFALPAEPTFICELNAYTYLGRADVKDKKNNKEYIEMERKYHQFSRAHRATSNTLPYSQNGGFGRADYTPKIEGKGKDARVVDWSAFDARYSSLLDGSLFIPENGYTGVGEGIPVAHFYLPFNECFPLEVDDYYKYVYPKEIKTEDDYKDMLRWHAENASDIEDAFNEEYWETTHAIVAEYMRHFEAKGWTHTQFQFYLNNKFMWKAPKFGGRGSSWWTLDEPMSYDDFQALRYYGEQYWKGVELSGVKSVNVQHRIDLSRPNMDHNILAGNGTLRVISSALVPKLHVVTESVRNYGEEIWFYGGGNQLETANTNLVASFIQRYGIGCDGGLPYYTSFARVSAWEKADRLAIVYPGTTRGIYGPVASVRLKLHRKSSNFIDMANMLAEKNNWSRADIGYALQKALPLNAKVDSKGADDPGKAFYVGLTEQDLETLRLRLIETLR